MFQMFQVGGGFLAGVQNAAGVVMDALQDDGVSEESDQAWCGGFVQIFENMSYTDTSIHRSTHTSILYHCWLYHCYFFDSIPVIIFAVF